MKDVFISYAREDTKRVVAFACTLEMEHLSVWYDHHILTATNWEYILTSELEQARCVVMIWSHFATSSV